MKFPVSRFTVNGNSMVPVLRPGQDVLSFNWAYLGRKPKRGDIVVVKVGSKEMVKRVDKVYDRTVYLQGDNLGDSTDSRDFGPVSINNIVGKVVYKSNVILGTSEARPPESRFWASQNDKVVAMRIPSIRNLWPQRCNLQKLWI